MGKERVIAQLRTLGLHASEAFDLFRALDINKNFLVEYSEFVQGCLHLKEPANKLDFEGLIAEIRHIKHSTNQFMSVTRKQLEQLNSKLADGASGTGTGHKVQLERQVASINTMT